VCFVPAGTIAVLRRHSEINLLDLCTLSLHRYDYEHLSFRALLR